MILNESDIYDSIESYRNKVGFNQDKMAEIMGLESKQAYSNMIKNKTMKMIYFVNLINKTGTSYEHFLDQNANYKHSDVKLDKVEESKTKITLIGCPDCIEKENTIRDLRANLNDLRKHIEFLEFSLGKKKAISK